MWRSLFAIGLAIGLGRPALAQPEAALPALHVGDPAPPLRVAAWVKGEPISAFAPGRVYAVEFWATWCGPCVAGIPHLTELQHELREHADFIGLTAEDESNTLDVVRQFVAAKGDAMDYRVAFDNGTTTWSTYMEAAGQHGIPCAFIIDKQSRVAWIGHPAQPQFAEVLKEIVEDRYDFEAAQKAAAEAAAQEEQIARTQAELHAAWSAGETGRALDLVDSIVASNPDAMRRWAWWKFETLMSDGARHAEAYAYVRSMLAGPYKDNADMLLQFTYGIADSLGIDDADMDLALHLAQRAVEITEGQDHRMLQGLAMVRMHRKEYDEAIAAMQRAIDIAPTPAVKDYLSNELEFYKLDKEYDAPG